MLHSKEGLRAPQHTDIASNLNGQRGDRATAGIAIVRRHLISYLRLDIFEMPLDYFLNLFHNRIDNTSKKSINIQSLRVIAEVDTSLLNKRRTNDYTSNILVEVVIQHLIRDVIFKLRKVAALIDSADESDAEAFHRLHYAVILSSIEVKVSRADKGYLCIGAVKHLIPFEVKRAGGRQNIDDGGLLYLVKGDIRLRPVTKLIADILAEGFDYLPNLRLNRAEATFLVVCGVTFFHYLFRFAFSAYCLFNLCSYSDFSLSFFIQV
nr:MAG TPA: hypothetical protein [Caudoviricetes sp.]